MSKEIGVFENRLGWGTEKKILTQRKKNKTFVNYTCRDWCKEFKHNRKSYGEK